MKWRYSQHLFAGIGEAYLARGDIPRADDFANQCLELATRTESQKYLVRGWRLKAAIAAARLHWDETEKALKRALLVAQKIDSPSQLWRTHLAICQFYRDLNQPDRAFASASAARKVLDQMGAQLMNPELALAFRQSSIFRQAYAQAEKD
jgi:hypothetical protein